jgi:hypothetical protein
MNETSQTLQAIGDLDYYDQRSVVLPHSITPLEAWNLIMAGEIPAHPSPQSLKNGKRVFLTH